MMDMRSTSRSHSCGPRPRPQIEDHVNAIYQRIPALLYWHAANYICVAANGQEARSSRRVGSTCSAFAGLLTLQAKNNGCWSLSSCASADDRGCFFDAKVRQRASHRPDFARALCLICWRGGPELRAWPVLRGFPDRSSGYVWIQRFGLPR